MTLAELADRCEQATGDDKVALVELECAIRAVCGAPGTPSDLPYTTSIDAAMTLVADGAPFILTNADLDGVAGDYSRWRAALVGGDPGMPTPCSTPALALCAAALRARSA